MAKLDASSSPGPVSIASSVQSKGPCTRTVLPSPRVFTVTNVSDTILSVTILSVTILSVTILCHECLLLGGSTQTDSLLVGVCQRLLEEYLSLWAWWPRACPETNEKCG
jgi:hypothetical protein